jgi:hypothetical protein
MKDLSQKPFRVNAPEGTRVGDCFRVQRKVEFETDGSEFMKPRWQTYIRLPDGDKEVGI